MSQTMPSLVEMLKAGVHFGHQSSRWHPKMEPYIFGTRNGIHVINLEKTLEELEKTLAYLKAEAANGKVVLFVGTKRQAREVIKQAALAAGMPYLTERWIGGLLTNFEECKRRLKKYRGLKQQIESGEVEKYTKKEQSTLKKQLEKMDKYLSGLVSLEKLPDILYIADLRIEKTAVTEARRIGLPVVAVCDTNVDPTKATYVIPANDDAVNSIRMISDLVVQAIQEGSAEFAKKKQTLVEEKKVVPEAPKKEKRALTKEQSI
jgi:small subunit ribosomal protein S2